MNEIKFFRELIIVSFISITMIYSQKFSGTIRDSISLMNVPFASIYFPNGEGVIANEEGRFSISITNQDTLFVSCMGYKTLRLFRENLKDTLIMLTPKAIELNSVIVSNKKRSISEILKGIRQNISEKYELGISKKKIFLRETGSQKFSNLKVKIKSTSISELKQTFWDSILNRFPKENNWYYELVGNLSGDYTKENQKLELLRALELKDKEKSMIFENIEKLFDTILKENVKTNSYFKVRSGIIGGKVEGDEFNSKIQDSLNSKEKIKQEKEDFLSWRKGVLKNMISSFFDKEKLNLNILKKSSKYEFTHTDFTYFGDTPVYVLSFIPKGDVDYKGKIYVDADLLCLIRIEYNNIQPIRDFSMFGVSFKEDVRKVIVQFKKLNSGRYSLEYLDYTSSFEGGFDRPLVITEKNKIVKGRNKQNQVKMDLDVSNRYNQRYQLVVFETVPIRLEAFNKINEKAEILPINKTSYDSDFWKGYSIIEPNTAIKNLTIENQK